MPYIKKIVSALFPALILSLLLSHPRLSADGAQKGLLLWFNTVFPTLFPFMLFSKLLAEHGGVRLLRRICCTQAEPGSSVKLSGSGTIYAAFIGWKSPMHL